MARATAHVWSFWKFFHFVNQFPRPARKNGHPVLSSRFLSRVFVITISSHLKHSNYNVSLEYSTNSPSSPPSTKRRRQRNIIWFNPRSANPLKPTSRGISYNFSINTSHLQVVCTKYSTATQLKLATAACLM
jgi:hypothetical protein